MATPVELRDGDRAIAVIYPELGGWLTRYARRTVRHGLVDALHHDPAVIARYPDRMWAGNPVLFPHVSYNLAKGQEGQYELNGRLYQSRLHGFARRVPWRVVRQAAAAVTMELTDSELTRPSYPFAFRHEITYRLVEGRLEWEQVVENRDRDSEAMLFSTGFHPYLPVPLVPGGERNRCFVRISNATRFSPVNQAEAYLEQPWPAQELSVGTDVSGTILLGKFANRELALVDPTAGLEVAVNFADAPAYQFAALWSRSVEEPFYCLEPWTALPNSFGRPDGEVTRLAPGANFRARLWMDVREL